MSSCSIAVVHRGAEVTFDVIKLRGVHVTQSKNSH